jgi:hypothetical protein
MVPSLWQKECKVELLFQVFKKLTIYRTKISWGWQIMSNEFLRTKLLQHCWHRYGETCVPCATIFRGVLCKLTSRRLTEHLFCVHDAWDRVFKFIMLWVSWILALSSHPPVGNVGHKYLIHNSTTTSFHNWVLTSTTTAHVFIDWVPHTCCHDANLVSSPNPLLGGLYYGFKLHN